MSVNPFDGPRAKVSRARKHINELKEREAAFFAEPAWELVEEEQEDGWKTLFAKMTKKAEGDIAPIVADIVGGLRSSLDLAVCAAARLAGATDLRNTYFHFASTEAEWDRSVAGRTKAAPPHIVQAVRAFAPWQGGSNLLYALSKVCVADKHQLLVPVVAHSGQASFESIRSFCGSYRIRGDGWDYEKNRIPLIDLAPYGSYQLDNIGLLSFFAFGEVDIVSRQPVVPISSQLADMCDEIINTLERASV